VNRRPIFVAVKALRNNQPFTLVEVAILDAAIDEACRDVEPHPHTVFHLSAFFTYMRGTRLLGPELTQGEVEGCEAILLACRAAEWPISWTAYALATAYHETAGTMQPIKEYGRGKGRKYGVPGKHGQIAYGRGYVQLTWDYNYEKADKKLELNGALIKDYDLALRHDIASQIMIRGMAEGWFTGKRMTILPVDGMATRDQFRSARPIINGRDKDLLIAGYALEFQKALAEGQWA
jgi:hypothetical protein